MSICSGAFALAAAGVLDGHAATTHWIYADALQERYPGIAIDRAPLYVDNGRVLTSAGCAAGLDLCLHIVRSDHGVSVANDVARRLVIAPHRAGGQAQYIETPVPEATDDGRIAAGMAWALEHLDAPITLDELAAQCAMSRRSFLRQFAKATGTTPIRWLIEQRVQASLPLLEASSLSIEQIGARVGFESPVTFRYHFVRQMQTTPVTTAPASPAARHNDRVRESFTENFAAALAGYGDRPCIEFDGRYTGHRGQSLRCCADGRV